MHGADLTPTYSSTTMLEVWDILAAADKYELDPRVASHWFKKWFEHHYLRAGWDKNFNDGILFNAARELMFPCHEFNYAIGFQLVTRYLVYHGRRHITEKRPDGFDYYHLRLDQKVIGGSRFPSIKSYLVLVASKADMTLRPA